MANDDLPGFIEDEPKPAKKAGPPPPAAAAGPAFDPFAGTKVTLDPTAAPVAPAAAPAARQPGTGRATKAAPAAPAADPGDADIAPGQGKDLWTCPHCDARNKPGRETCRSCGKSPQDEVVAPWHAKPAARIGMGIAALVVVVLIVASLFGGGDVELVPADAAHVDSAPRFGGRSEAVLALGEGRRFVGEKRFALCGRVLGALPAADGSQRVAVAVGRDAADETFSALAVDTANGEITTIPESDMVVVDLLTANSGPADTAKGAWLSLIGDAGYIESDGMRVKDGDDVPLVLVEAFQR
ncbi:MAG TPA: zinc finger Ran-binding domain-containing protein [Planctomycetota bacterium]|nr:zinc finger Ran-binding domain-containing protein [Planctomycetota bacterium]